MEFSIFMIHCDATGHLCVGVAEVEFVEWTPDKHLRNSRFVTLRQEEPKTVYGAVSFKIRNPLYPQYEGRRKLFGKRRAAREHDRALEASQRSSPVERP